MKLRIKCYTNVFTLLYVLNLWLLLHTEIKLQNLINPSKYYLSKSENGLTANVCCLSSLYPFVVATASSASRGV